MERPIEFRGKALNETSYRKKGEWCYGYYVHNLVENTHSIITNTFPQIKFEVDPKSVGQFTGLTDKHGAKIWENDVIKTRFNELALIKWDTASEMKGKDLFEYTGFVAQQLSTGTNYHLDRSICLGEVIGNIHENPELITCKTEK